MSWWPFVRSPLTDVTAGLCNHQRGGPCADFEMRMVDCMEAYGEDKGVVKCDLLIRDFRECVGQHKQQKRYTAMKMERYRQYYAGERSKEELYAEPPKVNSY